MIAIWLAAAVAAFGQTGGAPPQSAMSAALEKQRASVAAQRESVRRQASAAAVWLVPWDPVPVMGEAVCEALPDAVVAPLIESAAKAQQVESRVLRAVIEQESAFRPCAVSWKGAAGLMQLMPATVQQLEVKDPFDPRESIDGGAKFLKQLLDRYKGDLPRALGAYNAGPAAVDEAGGLPDIPETREYVDAILRKLGITRTVQPNSPKPRPTGN